VLVRHFSPLLSPAFRSRSRIRVMRNPVSVRKKNSPISNGMDPRQAGGDQ
ncbi:MAG: hypothetical protein RLZZ214_4279, partial [Verrucomicrobiota bacterium]